jgi:S-adenosylhomocysteine hydrolase
MYEQPKIKEFVNGEIMTIMNQVKRKERTKRLKLIRLAAVAHMPAQIALLIIRIAACITHERSLARVSPSMTHERTRVPESLAASIELADIWFLSLVDLSMDA